MVAETSLCYCGGHAADALKKFLQSQARRLPLRLVNAGRKRIRDSSTSLGMTVTNYTW